MCVSWAGRVSPTQLSDVRRAELGWWPGWSLGQVESRPSACAAVLYLQCWRRPIRFPGHVPNSVVLQQMRLPVEVGGLGALGKARGGAGRGLRGAGPAP